MAAVAAPNGQNLRVLRHNCRPDTYRKLPADPCAEGHNSAQFLDVVWLQSNDHWRAFYHGEQAQRRGARGIVNRRGGIAPGWYVVRTCPQHRGVIVSRRCDSILEAEACVRLLVEVTFVFET